MVVTLIGYRASGKTSVAPRLAKRLGLSWADCDDEIERQAGVSIREIFEHEGEAGFRRRESEVLTQLLERGNIVVASGGGAVLAESNRQKMRAAGPVVWLQTSVDVLARRLGDRHSSHRRPSLTGRPIAEEVADVLAVREPLYKACSTLVVDANLDRSDRIARTIADQLIARYPALCQSSATLGDPSRQDATEPSSDRCSTALNRDNAAPEDSAE